MLFVCCWPIKLIHFIEFKSLKSNNVNVHAIDYFSTLKSCSCAIFFLQSIHPSSIFLSSQSLSLFHWVTVEWRTCVGAHGWAVGIESHGRSSSLSGDPKMRHPSYIQHDGVVKPTKKFLTYTLSWHLCNRLEWNLN